MEAHPAIQSSFQRHHVISYLFPDIPRQVGLAHPLAEG